MTDINKNTKSNREGFKFGPVTHQLGDKNKTKYCYECRIMDHQSGKQDRVLVYASDFGDVKWCMMGYVKRPLVLVNTSIRTVKHLIMPDDIGEQRFVIIVVRNK